MSSTLQERLKQTIDTAGKSEKDLRPEETRAVCTKILGLFRLRLQPPFFYQIYTPVNLIGGVLAKVYPDSGGKINSLLTDLIKEEPETLKLLPFWGINVIDPPNEKEAHMLAKLSKMKGYDENSLREVVLEFLELS